MKNTKVFLVSFLIFIITVLLINTAVWWLEDTYTWKKCLGHGGTLFSTILFGWIPAVIIGYDYEAHLDNKNK
jgi:hypothetical protein